MDQESVAGFHGALLKVFVCAVNGVAGLKGDDPFPPAFFECGPGLLRSQVVVLVFDGTRLQKIDVAREKNGTERLGVGRAWVRIFRGLVDLLGDFFVIDVEFFGQMQNCANVAFVVFDGNLFSDFDTAGIFVAHGQQDGDRPWDSVPKVHFVDYVAGFLFVEEAGQGTEYSLSDAIDVEGRIGVHGNFR